MTKEEKLYLKCRKAGEPLHSQMIDLLSEEDLTAVGKHLGMYHGDTFIFDSEEETHFFMEYAIYDYLGRGQRIIEIFTEQIIAEDLTDVQKMLLEGALKAWFSLFEICDVQSQDKRLILRDLIYQKENITLIDVNLSSTAVPGLLVAARLIPIQTWYMTTGAGFPFPPELKQILLRGLRIPIRKGKKKKYKTLPPNRYSSYFFRQYKQLSDIEFMSQDVT